jgi:hypothetical protein
LCGKANEKQKNSERNEFQRDATVQQSHGFGGIRRNVREMLYSQYDILITQMKLIIRNSATHYIIAYTENKSEQR